MESESPSDREAVSEDGDDSPFEDPVIIVKQPPSATEALQQMIHRHLSQGEMGRQLLAEKEELEERKRIFERH